MPREAQSSLRRRMFQASFWTALLYVTSQSIRFGSNLYFARLLAPEAFGIIAIAMVILVAVAVLSDVGLRLNIIRSDRGHEQSFLDTAWTFQVLRGVFLWLIVVGLSFALSLANSYGIIDNSSAYGNSTLPAALLALSFIALIGGLESTKLSVASRQLTIGRASIIDLVSQLFGLAVGVAWLQVDRSVWALIVATLCSSLVRTFAGHVFLPGPINRPRWDYATVIEIIHFGKWILVASLFGFLALNADRLILAGLLSAQELGLYSIALALVLVIEQIVVKAITDIAFPVLSELGRAKRNIKAAYYKFHLVIASASYFFSGMLFVAGPAIISTLYDHRYADAGMMLSALAPILLSIPARLTTQSLLVFGTAQSYMFPNFVRAVALLIFVPIAFRFGGAAEAAAAVSLAALVTVPASIYLSIKYRFFDIRRELLPLPMILIGAASGYGVASFLMPIRDWVLGKF